MAKLGSVQELINKIDRASDSDSIAEACAELLKLGPKASAAVPALIKLLSDDREIDDASIRPADQALRCEISTVQDAAAYVLGHIGEGALSAVPDLITMMVSRCYDAAADGRSAAYALNNIDPGCEPARRAAIAELEKIATVETQGDEREAEAFAAVLKILGMTRIELTHEVERLERMGLHTSWVDEVFKPSGDPEDADCWR